MQFILQISRLFILLTDWLIEWYEMIAVCAENITASACNHNWTWKGKEENYSELNIVSTTRLNQEHGDTFFFLWHYVSHCFTSAVAVTRPIYTTLEEILVEVNLGLYFEYFC